MLEGERGIILNCSQTNGSVSADTATWLVNGSELTREQIDLYYTEHHNNSLTIRMIFNSASFQCILNRHHSNIGYLTVVSPYHPDIFFSRQPQDETVFTGDTVTFYCTAPSLTTETVATWVINGTIVPHTELIRKPEFKLNNNNSLTVTALKNFNGTSFLCILDRVQSRTGYLYLNSTTQLVPNSSKYYVHILYPKAIRPWMFFQPCWICCIEINDKCVLAKVGQALPVAYTLMWCDLSCTNTCTV